MSTNTPAQTNITSHPTSLICHDTDLQGSITIGPGTILHPKCSVLALGGPIVLGADCVIEENAVVVNRGAGVMRIGDGNTFMVGCRVECDSIGRHNTFGVKSKVSSGLCIPDHCSFGAGTVTLPSHHSGAAEDAEVIEPYTVVFGEQSQHRTWDGSTLETERYLREKHVEYLREVLPKFNRMRAV